MNDNETCWQYTTADESKIYVAYFHKLAAPNLPFRRAHLVGLDQKARYTLAGTQEGYMGDALIHNGLPLPYVSTSHVKPNIRYLAKGDFSSHLFELNKEGSH